MLFSASLFRSICPLIAVLSLPLITSGCGSEGKGGATQVAAKVNKQEISVHQINAQLASTSATPEELESVSRKILERLIDQELLIQQAAEQKLDRTPAVVQAIESAKRSIVTQSYVESLTAQVNKPGADEVKTFYAENPALFTERRIYTLRELKVIASPAQVPAIQARAANIKDIEEITPWLRDAGLEFTTTAGAKAAEEFPGDLLDRFSKLQDGDIGVLRNASGLVILQLVSSIEQPLTEAQAQPVIERLLLAQKKSELLKAEVARLRGIASIEYAGEFSAQAVAKSPEAADTATEESATSGASSASMAKGVSRLQ
ncbi:MAG: EpsD family peptidyl-prolyl cis-trans isomerase [Spongiibacteraceae bacterium]